MPFLTLEMFLRVANGLRSYETTLSKANANQREKIADYLDSISDTLRSIVKNANENKDITEHCAALKVYSEDLFDVLRRHTKLSTRDLTNILAYAQSTRIAYVQKKKEIKFTIDGSHHFKPELQSVEEAAGIFKATAARLRVPPDRHWWQFWKD